MSNERSPRESCCTTIGTRGMSCNLQVACFHPWSPVTQPVSCRSVPMAVVNREVVLPVDRERAWELITEPAELEEWLGDDVEFEASEDAPLRVGEREGVVEEVTEFERIVFRWGDSRVEWQLEDAISGGTRFLVTEIG